MNIMWSVLIVAVMIDVVLYVSIKLVKNSKEHLAEDVKGSTFVKVIKHLYLK